MNGDHVPRWASYLCVIQLLTLALCVNANERVDAMRDWEKARIDYAEGRYDSAHAQFLMFAASGFKEGAHVMGIIYEEGKAVPRSMSLAMQYFECAASAGYAQSQIRAAHHLVGSPDVKRDYAKAYFWAALAASNREVTEEFREFAIKIRDRAARYIDHTRYASIDKDLREWQPTPQTCYFKR